MPGPSDYPFEKIDEKILQNRPLTNKQSFINKSKTSLILDRCCQLYLKVQENPYFQEILGFTLVVKSLMRNILHVQPMVQVQQVLILEITKKNRLQEIKRVKNVRQIHLESRVD